MRRWLTWFVRRPQSIAGNGERIFWNGELDAVLDTIGRAVGHPYPLPPGEYVLPRRFRPCPSCGDTERVQYRVVGMPPAPPRVLDESRVRDEGCTVDEVELGGDWYCPACDAFYHHVQPRLWTVGYAGVAAGERNPSDSCDGLTIEELGQIYRDIVVGRPTRVSPGPTGSSGDPRPRPYGRDPRLSRQHERCVGHAGRILQRSVLRTTRSLISQRSFG